MIPQSTYVAMKEKSVRLWFVIMDVKIQRFLSPMTLTCRLRRWRVENGIAEAVKFFHLNALSSPILVKVHFDVAMTMIADTLYCMLAKRLRGFEDCDAPKIYRHFVRGKGTVSVKNKTVTVTYPRRAHNPILRKVPWNQLPTVMPAMKNVKLQLRFK